eukprot:765068-Hanusia_phi.AAC.2
MFTCRIGFVLCCSAAMTRSPSLPLLSTKLSYNQFLTYRRLFPGHDYGLVPRQKPRNPCQHYQQAIMRTCPGAIGYREKDQDTRSLAQNVTV